MKKKFLFLYIQAGGGHISTAKAIAKYIDQHHGEVIDPILVDGFTQAPRRLKKIIIDGYKKSQTTGQRVYEFLYWCNKRRFIAKVNQFYHDSYKDISRNSSLLRSRHIW
jgi:UDP-N-acetylglucosamine:LPS N-acetylglucosamine transferase